MSEPRVLGPDADQPDFGVDRYLTALVERWWLAAAGLIVGAAIGFAVSTGAGLPFKATSILYLGQPYSSAGSVPLQNLHTSPGTVKTIAHLPGVIAAVARACRTEPSEFSGGISTQPVAGNIPANGQTPEVALSVQGRKSRVTGCEANGLAAAVVARTSAYADSKIASFRVKIEDDEEIGAIVNQALAQPLPTSDKLVLQLRIIQAQQDQLGASQLLAQAAQVERPSVVTSALPTRVIAPSRRASVAIAAVVGLLLGAVAALAWGSVDSSDAPRTAA